MFLSKLFKGIVNDITVKLTLLFIVGFLLTVEVGASSRRYIFIDGGTHYGKCLLMFKKTNLYSRYPWEIFAIEANPYVIDKIPKASDITIINKAIWIEEGAIQFNINTKDEKISSILWKNDDTVEITVESIDFGKWLEENFKKEDYIIVSFDIEGAEYEILNKMVADGTMQYIDRLYVEFHDFGPGRGLSEREKELITKISKLSIIVGAYSAEEMIGRGYWLDSLE